MNDSDAAGRALQRLLATFEAGRPAEAERLAAELVEAHPDLAAGWSLFGALALQDGRNAEAEPRLARAVDLDPDNAAAWTDLARARLALDQRNAAARAAKTALALGADAPGLHCCLGHLWHGVRQHAKAEAAFRQALRREPANLEALSGLYPALVYQHRGPEIAEPARAVIAALAGDGEKLLALARTLDDQDLRDLALEALERAVQAAPQDPATLLMQATLLAETGRTEAALAFYRRALAAAAPEDAARIHSAYLMALHYVPGPDRQEIFDEHRRWAERHAPPCPPRPVPARPDPGRRLRVGMVSANFRNFATAHFLLPVLEARPAAEWSATLYSTTARPDSYTERFAATADAWREARDWSDADLLAAIRDDGIDVLFDLDGHTRGHRLGVFARRPAPVQVTWLDYIDTTGLAAMDHILCDPYQVPEDEWHWYVERVEQMPGDHICYRPLPDAPDVAPPPCLQRGYVTFGCFNSAMKISDPAIAAWARILQRVPDARLLVNTPEMRHEAARRRLYRRMAAHGVEGRRIETGTGGPQHDFLAAHAGIDIALDPFPYSGGLTTCEALWMGVPVVTFPGERYCSRHAGVHLTTAGFPDLVAADRQGYEDLAVALAGDRDRLAGLRSALRPSLAASPLVDGAAFARKFSDAIRRMWQRACAEVA